MCLSVHAVSPDDRKAASKSASSWWFVGHGKGGEGHAFDSSCWVPTGLASVSTPGLVWSAGAALGPTVARLYRYKGFTTSSDRFNGRHAGPRTHFAPLHE